MTSDQLRARVEEEIAGDWTRENPHGVDLRQCLVQPTKLHYEDSFDEGKHLSLWLVLEEKPDSHDGYKIVYDEDEDAFGLAIKGRADEDVFIGFYGTFLNTLDGM